MPPSTNGSTENVVVSSRQAHQDALGAQIKKLREEQDMSQTDLGLALARFQPDREPVPQTTISRWEKGQAALATWQVNDIERALGIREGSLLVAAGVVKLGSVQADNDEKLLLEVVRSSSAIHPELRSDVQVAIRSFLNTSNRLFKRDDSIARLRQI
jgi:transcriptional regulator with XRE-family HTH domain